MIVIVIVIVILMVIVIVIIMIIIMNIIVIVIIIKIMINYEYYDHGDYDHGCNCEHVGHTERSDISGTALGAVFSLQEALVTVWVQNLVIWKKKGVHVERVFKSKSLKLKKIKI